MSKPTGKISKELALEIAAIAGDAGARAAVEAYKKESERSARERSDRRLHNTELLLKNYACLRRMPKTQYTPPRTLTRMPMTLST